MKYSKLLEVICKKKKPNYYSCWWSTTRSTVSFLVFEKRTGALFCFYTELLVQHDLLCGELLCCSPASGWLELKLSAPVNVLCPCVTCLHATAFSIILLPYLISTILGSQNQNLNSNRINCPALEWGKIQADTCKQGCLECSWWWLLEGGFDWVYAQAVSDAEMRDEM